MPLGAARLREADLDGSKEASGSPHVAPAGGTWPPQARRPFRPLWQACGGFHRHTLRVTPETHTCRILVSCKRAITQFLVVLDMLICIDHLKDIKKMHTLLTAMACITSISNSTYSTGTSFNIFVCPRENKNKKEARTSACKCLGAISSDWSLSTNQESFFPRFPRKFVRMLFFVAGTRKENGKWWMSLRFPSASSSNLISKSLREARIFHRTQGGQGWLEARHLASGEFSRRLGMLNIQSLL